MQIADIIQTKVGLTMMIPIPQEIQNELNVQQQQAQPQSIEQSTTT